MKKADAEKRLQFLVDVEEALYVGPHRSDHNYGFMYQHPEAFNQYHPNFSEVQELLKIIVES